MAAPIGSLVVKVGSDVSQLVIGFDKGKKEARSFGSVISKTSKVLAGLGVAAGVAGFAIATKFAKDGLASVDAMVKLGRTVGATQAEMVGLARTADLVGVSQEQMTGTIQRFTKRLGEAQQGTGQAIDALKELNLSAEDLIRLPLPEALALVAERVQDLDSAAAKAAVASDLLGRRGTDLVLTTDNLAESLRLGVKETKAFGVAVSQVDAAQIEAANDAMSRIGVVFKGIANQFAVVLAPVLQEISDNIADASEETGGFRNAIIDAFESGIRLAFAFQDAIKFVEIAAKSTGLAFLETKLFFEKLNPTSTLEDLRIINTEIETLANEINELVDLEDAETRAEGFFARLRERLEEARKEAMSITTGEDVGEPLGILDPTQESRLAAIDKFNEERREKEFSFQNELTKIQQEGETSRQRFEKMAMTDKLATVTGAFAAVTSIVADQNKEMFEINKAFQIADAVVNGIAGAIRTWNSVPYPWNIPLTAAHVAGTAAQIIQLSSQQFQGGRQSAAPVPAVATPTGGGDGGGTIGDAGGGVAPSTVNIALQGRSFGREQVRDLISEINDAVSDGARIRVV